jgi:hypothetical protein
MKIRAICAAIIVSAAIATLEARHYTLREIAGLWPELAQFEAGPHAFVATNPSAYVFKANGTEWRVDYGAFDQYTGNDTLQEFVTSSGLQNQLPITASDLEVPCFTYYSLSDNGSYTIAFRPENCTDWPNQNTTAPSITLQETLEAYSPLENFKSSVYAYRAPGTAQRYLKYYKGVMLELRLVQFFASSPVQLSEVLNWFNLWDLKTLTVTSPFGELEVFLCPSSEPPYRPEPICKKLGQQDIQILISVKEHPVSE